MTNPELDSRIAASKERDLAPALIMMLILALSALLFLTAMNFRATRSFRMELSAAIARMNQLSTAGVLLTPVGWKPGEFAPAVPISTLEGADGTFRTLARNVDVVYVGWDRCPICLEHFPNMQLAAAKLEESNLRFALVVLLSADAEVLANPGAEVADLVALQQQHGWTFPVYTIDRKGMLELNLQGTPTALILRNGVFGEAFPVGSLDQLLSQLILKAG